MEHGVLTLPGTFLRSASARFVRVTIPKGPAAAEVEGMSARIVAIAKAADRQSFAELFRYYAPRVKAYLARLGSDGGKAEELMQEIMVTVWRKAGQFDPTRASASAWIFAIARNHRIDAFRREKHPEFDPDDPALVPEAEMPADAAMISEEAGRRLRDALTALPEAEQGVLRMAYFEDKSHTDISEELRIPLGTVKSRVRLAFGRLRAALGEDGEEMP